MLPSSQNSGKTAAMIAASNGSTEILKAMGRGPSLLNLKDADGGTAVMTAAVHKHSSVLDFVRLPHAQTEHFRTRHRSRLPTWSRARDRTRRDKTPRSRSFPERVPGNPRHQRQNRLDFFPGSQTTLGLRAIARRSREPSRRNAFSTTTPSSATSHRV